ncbi:hypothetical protein DSOL_5374 [Desulfosporosinus metallidurans]|uniref:Uncharacterized protein n=1 Tax=Desulfosporosinus metallidurans TaxID=1888891 RepID=A0A1Q8QCK8_9FIRM|nr:hypothetical protein DSOL_5374 [Desulfosporosinus metallidurans]
MAQPSHISSVHTLEHQAHGYPVQKICLVEQIISGVMPT